MLGRTNLKVSRLGLGTAEIGFAYGIGLRTLPSEDEAVKLLKKAVNLGINYFDTAYFYGLAEERIGKSGIAKKDGIVIATKCGQFLEKGEDPRGKELEKRLREQIEASLKNLKVDSVSVLMLHGGSEEQIKRGELVHILKKFQTEGKAGFLGISTRGEEAPLAAIESGVFDVVQTAYSILDQRMAKRVLFLALKKNIGIVNRSVLLKGSLTGLVSKLPKGLEMLQRNSGKAKKIAEELGCDLPELAIRFTLSEPSISTSLIGTNKIENLEKSCRAIEAGPLPEDVIKKLRKLAIDDPMQVDPSKWPPLV